MSFFTRLKIAFRWNYRKGPIATGLDTAAKSFILTLVLAVLATLSAVFCALVFVFFPLWHFLVGPVLTSLIYTDKEIWDNLKRQLKK